MNGIKCKLYGRCCYGYYEDYDGNIYIDKEKARIVLEIFKRYEEGYSLGGIVAWLKENNVSSPTGKEKWQRATIDKMLSNISYVPHILDSSRLLDIQDIKYERSNIDYDENGKNIRKSTRYNSRKVMAR